MLIHADEPTTWDAAAAEVVRAIRSRIDVRSLGFPRPLDDLREHFDVLLHDHQTGLGRLIELDWTQEAISLAVTGYQASGCAVDLEALPTLLANKQADYGHDNILRFGIDGVLVRMHDKVARLENLASKGRDAANESVLDSYSDFIGYCVILVMLDNDWFKLPLERDAERDVDADNPA